MADSTGAAVGLIETARPDAVVVDLWLGFDSDYDLIQMANDRVPADRVLHALRGRDEGLHVPARRGGQAGPRRPGAGPHPARRGRPVPPHHRPRASRSGPSRTAEDATASGIDDARAFFEAVNEAKDGDGIISIDLWQGADSVASVATQLLRQGDRVLAFPTAVRLYLPGGGEEGVRSVLQRVADNCVATQERTVASVVVEEGELGADAFDRLKHRSEMRWL